MEKSTEELIHALKEAKNVTEYLKYNEEEFVPMSLEGYLSKLLEQKNMEKADVIRRSRLNQVYAYQIFSGSRNPSRNKVLALAFGFSMTVAETQKLLRYANHSQLYVRSQRDSIIMFALNQQFDILVCNELLDEAGEILLD